jgi:histidyl-tRNA synthetase
VVFGADELAQGQVAVKSLRDRAEAGAPPAQTLVPLAGLQAWAAEVPRA